MRVFEWVKVKRVRKDGEVCLVGKNIGGLVMAKEAVARKKAVEVEEDDWRQRAERNRKEKKDGGMFKLPEGPTTFRILKTPADKQRQSPWVWMEYYVHRNVGPKKVGPVRCGLNVADDSGNCWLCAMVEKLRENGKTLAAAEMDKKKTYAIQVAVWDENLQSLRGPLLWATSSGKTAKSLSYKLESIIAAPASKRYVDHEDGYNFTIERSGTGINDTVYGAPERAEERTEVPKEVLAKLKPFADVIAPYDKEAQKRAYYGETAKARDEEQEDAAPVRRKIRFEEEEEAPKSRRRAVVEEDEEDSIEAESEVDEELEEDDEDATPVKQARKPQKDDDEEEEEEDLEFGEDEEDGDDAEAEEDEADEEPVSKKKPVARKR